MHRYSDDLHMLGYWVGLDAIAPACERAQQELALQATLLQPALPALRLPHRELGAGETLSAPIGATGILIGTTARHHPMPARSSSFVPGKCH